MAAVNDWERLNQLVATLAPRCAEAGCKLAEARQLLAQAEKLVGRNAKGAIVSQALWCDQGGHAFSARDPKSEHWEREVTREGSSEKVTIPWDVCGTCMQAINARLAQMESEVRQAPPPGASMVPADHAVGRHGEPMGHPYG